MRFLSIQSSVAYGYVGNTSAGFCLRRLGHEVWAVDTVHFSNHSGYGHVRGPVFDPDDIREVITGVGERGAFPAVDAVISGYQGAETVGAVILDAVDQVKAANPNALYCCDPVMGDVGRGFYVRPGIPEFLRASVLPRADLLIPNQFELEFLSGHAPGTLTELSAVLDAVDALRAAGPGMVLVTSLHTRQIAADEIAMLAVTDEGAWSVRTPRLPIQPTGSGDATSAIFLSHLLQTGAEQALAVTAASIYGILESTIRRGRSELDLVHAQEQLVAPTHTFTVERVR